MFPRDASPPAPPRVGLEPTTLRLTAGCSTIELSRKTVQSPAELFKNRFALFEVLCLQLLLYFQNCISNLMSPMFFFASHLSLLSRTIFRSCTAALLLLNKLLDLLVPVSSTYLYALTSGLSPCRLQGVLLLSDGISLLEVGFTLRCLQRLSLPDLATLLCSWSATDAPAVRPFRSSRTKNSSSQISYAHDG